MSDPLLPTPLHDAIDKLGAGGDGLELDVSGTSAGDAGASVSATKSFGKDKTWSFSAAAAWARGTGAAAIAKLKWTPR